MLGFMVTTMFLSMWISNTATTAMMLPIVDAVAEAINAGAQVGRLIFQDKKWFEGVIRDFLGEHF